MWATLKKTLILMAVLLCGASLVANAQVPCKVPLLGFGPIDPANGFPKYYVDSNHLGLAACLDPVCDPAGIPSGLPDPALPVSFPDNFPAEFFYQRAISSMSGPNGESFLLVIALEASFANGVPVNGDQVVFTRVRIRGSGLVVGATYTFRHPFGTESIVAVAAAPGAPNINFTRDFGLVPLAFGGAVNGDVGPFLTFLAGPVPPPPGNIGNPAADQTVTGSPCGQNFFSAAGGALPVGGRQTDQFSTLIGKKASVCGNGVVDAGENCDDGNALDGDCCSSFCLFEALGSPCLTDTNPCTDQGCNGAGACSVVTFNTVPCNDLNPCTTDACANGLCEGVANNANTCSDGNACTLGDFCSAGRCISGLLPTCVTTSIAQDASVVSTTPTTLFGTTTTLEADQTSATAFRQSFLRFNVSGIGTQAVTSARLRLQVSNLAGSNSASGGRAHVSGCAWDESTVTWNNRPAFNPIPLSTLGAVNTLGQIVEFDVTPAVQVDGAACFAIDSLSNDTVRYNSREAGVGAPQLVVSKGCACGGTPTCGDGLVNQVTEFCDGAANAACPGGCRPDCLCAVCGDGIINQAAEQCDGAAPNACTGLCTATCTCAAPVCGDGLLNQAAEQCDGAASAACPGACLANCRCPVVPFCGDGLVNQASEQCDGAANATCTLGCTPACTCVTPAARCGDGIINQVSEQCDGAAVGACTNGCTATCTCAAAAPVCGDGVVNQPTELCDGAANAACPNGCTATCTCAAAAPRCGDGIINQASEQCDGAALGTCVNGCTATCTCAAAGGAVTASVVADTSVRIISPTTNFGTSGLDVDANSAKEAFLRINVTGIGTRTVASAKLRLLVPNVAGNESNSGGRIHTMSAANCTWNETTVTWDTKPTIDGPVLSTLGAVALGQTVEFDITSAVHDGTFCLGIDSLSQDNARYASREAATGKPQIIITLGGAATPVCGDGIINQASEQCDGAAVGTCTNGCTATCLCAAPAPRCGDGIINQASEQCDGAAVGACLNGCTATCTCAAPAPRCGDGIINQASEQCDGAAVGACTNGCTATCTCAAAAPRCGDGIINQASEQCDGAAVGACVNGCTATCTCAAAGGVVTASVVADVTARAASPTTTFGTASVLDVDANSAKETYFRLSVSGIGARRVASAKLRLVVPNTVGADSPSGGRIHTMTNCTWNEATVTWNTKPVIDGPVLSTLGAVTLGQTVEFDITSAVHDGTFCLGADSLVADNARYSSREASANKPVVIITLAP